MDRLHALPERGPAHPGFVHGSGDIGAGVAGTLRDQHPAQDRDPVIAVALSELVAGHVTPIDAISQQNTEVDA